MKNTSFGSSSANRIVAFSSVIAPKSRQFAPSGSFGKLENRKSNRLNGAHNSRSCAGGEFPLGRTIRSRALRWQGRDTALDVVRGAGGGGGGGGGGQTRPP